MSEVTELRERRQDLQDQLNTARENLATLATESAAALVEGKEPKIGDLSATRERIAFLEAALPEVTARLAEAGQREAEAKTAAAVKEAEKARKRHGELIGEAHLSIREALSALEEAAKLRPVMTVSGQTVTVASIGDKRINYLRSDLRYLEHHFPAACGVPTGPTAVERGIQSLETKLADLRRELQDLPRKEGLDPLFVPSGGWEGLRRKMREEIEGLEAELKGWKAKAKQEART